MRIDAAAGLVVLGDTEGSVRFGLDNRVSDVRHAGDALPVHLTISASALRAALDNMAGNRARSQLVVILRAPAEAVQHRGEGQSGIRGPAGDHDIGSGGQSLR